MLSLHPDPPAIEKLLRVARESFEFVIVDTGSSSGDLCEALFEAAATVYLVTQVGIAELRNGNRFVRRYFGGGDARKLEIVLNRFHGRNLEIDEASVAKALRHPVKWRVPNDYQAVRHALNTGIPIVSETSAVSRTINEMARAASGPLAAPAKKKKFGLFG
jgi:pilus assembly protein CpaE